MLRAKLVVCRAGGSRWFAHTSAVGVGVVRAQHIIDRFTLAHSQLIAAADRAGVWQGTGARDMADWLTNTTQTSYGNAKGLLELGETADAAPEVAAAVAAGELSAASATALHDAVTTVILPALQSRQFINAINFVAGTPGKGDGRTTEQRLADGLVMLCDALAKGEVKGGRERPTVLLVFDVEAYLGGTGTPARTANGDRVPACVARHLAESAHLQRVTQAGSRILDLGNVVRLASDDHYRVLHVLGDAHSLRIQLANGTVVDCTQRRASAAA